MTALAVEKNLTDKKEKRAKSIAAMGLVNREADKFLVSTPSLRGKQTSYEVWRDEAGKIRCNCLEFEESAAVDSAFRCEHILAVKYALVAKNTESATKQPVKVETSVEVKPSQVAAKDKNVTESRPSKRGEQKSDEVQENVSVEGHAEMQKVIEPNHLTNTQGDKKMTQANQKEMPSVNTGQTEETANNNVLNFSTTLRELRKNVDPELVKQREGWRDRNGNTHYVDYVEWHTVADILDETAPNWSHTIRDIKQIGDIFTVTVAITIDGITREGIGTGTADSEMGIKKAEHDALKRAAVKFGIARDLYKKESDTIEREGAVPPPSNDGFPANPIAKSLSDLVTAKQLGMIRAISREINVDADEECQNVMQCKTDELSKRAASGFIQHLQDLQKQNVETQMPLRRAG
ncbi:MAG TPA: Rad52/Rad22 family DNA repair protein [Pyrinomonadaceae bacterium]|nr:Rad52/Rad22 family DNA repair protein [Pyrinomonadaceae bacterium]